MIGAIILAMTAQPTPAQAVLLRAAEIVEQGWTQQVSARDCTGAQVTAESPQACQWCALGAVRKAWIELGDSTDIEWGQAQWDACALATERINLRRSVRISITNWNDMPRRTPAQVAKMLREAATL